MLVLASASPRRQELLRNAGIPFEVQPAHIDEDPYPDETAKDCAERLAREKALSGARQRPHRHVLGADTVVVVDGQLLGKPARFRRRSAHVAAALRTQASGDHRSVSSVQWRAVGGKRNDRRHHE